MPETPVAKPLAQFGPSSSSRLQRSRHPASHYAGFPGSGTPVSSNPRHNPNWSPGPQNAQWNAAPNRPYANPPSGGKGKGGGQDMVETQEGIGIPSLSAAQAPQWQPLSSQPSKPCQQPPFPTSHQESSVLPATLRNSHMNTII
jgi:hypothetical protein